MLKYLKNRKEADSKAISASQQGFTIIEVLIVLAIAGLILLVVFLAVPALQRNQRNSGRKTDGSRIAAAVNDFVSNSNGTTPSSQANLTTIINGAGNLSNLGTLTANTVASPVPSCGTGGALAAGKVSLCTGATTGAFTASADAVMIATTAQCNGADQTSSGSARQVAVLYTQETSSGFNLACLNI